MEFFKGHLPRALNSFKNSVTGATTGATVGSSAVSSTASYSTAEGGAGQKRLPRIVSHGSKKSVAYVEVECDPAWLAAHPPIWRSPNKQILAEISRSSVPPASPAVFTRWAGFDVNSLVYPNHRKNTRLIVKPGVFDYLPTPEVEGPREKIVEWHVNFADLELFGFYSGPLFAQDEIQVAEHPSLGAIRQGLLALKPEDLPPDIVLFPTAKTRDDNDNPTPVLVRNVERRVAVDVAPNPEAPGGLYGNRFMNASEAAVRLAAMPLPDDFPRTNLIALQAPRGGRGPYTKSQIYSILEMAYAGFAAAKQQSEVVSMASTVVVHTGHWGTGAFGGHRVLTALLQILAARLAGVHVMVFHSFDSSESVHEAERLLDDLSPKGDTVVSPRVIVDSLINHDPPFEWNMGDGN